MESLKTCRSDSSGHQLDQQAPSIAKRIRVIGLMTLMSYPALGIHDAKAQTQITFQAWETWEQGRVPVQGGVNGLAQLQSNNFAFSPTHYYLMGVLGNQGDWWSMGWRTARPFPVGTACNAFAIVRGSSFDNVPMALEVIDAETFSFVKRVLFNVPLNAGWTWHSTPAWTADGGHYLVRAVLNPSGVAASLNVQVDDIVAQCHK